MFLIKTYRLILTHMIAAMSREARKKHKEACDLNDSIAAPRGKQVEVQKEGAKLATEADRLKAMLG